MSPLENFENYLRENPIKAPSFHPYFEEALNYMLFAGGKHFRAQLCLGVVEAMAPKKLSKAMPIALAIEMIHTYSLIHDDLPSVDNADFRRGIATIHKKYDEVSAILVGDALNTEAFYRISRADLNDNIKIKCVEILSKNAGSAGMVLGQAIDCFFEKKQLEISQVEFLHRLKTGALIGASLALGATISEIPKEKTDKIYEIGLKLGLAFQINDDLIDATSSDKIAGKPVGHDEFKNSFTNIIGIENSKLYKNRLIGEILNENFEPKLKKMVENLIEKYLKG